jgi:hypothetical protein
LAAAELPLFAVEDGVGVAAEDEDEDEEDEDSGFSETFSGVTPAIPSSSVSNTGRH